MLHFWFEKVALKKTPGIMAALCAMAFGVCFFAFWNVMDGYSYSFSAADYSYMVISFWMGIGLAGAGLLFKLLLWRGWLDAEREITLPTARTCVGVLSALLAGASVLATATIAAQFPVGGPFSLIGFAATLGVLWMLMVVGAAAFSVCSLRQKAV